MVFKTADKGKPVTDNPINMNEPQLEQQDRRCWCKLQSAFSCMDWNAPEPKGRWKHTNL